MNYNNGMMYGPMYGVPTDVQQPQPMAAMAAMPQSSLNGFNIDFYWTDNNLLKLEDTKYLLDNLVKIRHRINRMYSNSILTLVTNNILHNMIANMEASNNNKSDSITLLNSEGNWSLIFKVAIDNNLIARRVYLESKPIAYGSLSPLDKTLDSVLSNNMNRFDNNKDYTNNGYYTAFSNMISITPVSAYDAYKIYMDIIYEAVGFIHSEVTKNISRDANGRWVISGSLAELITQGFINVCGINIKPTVDINNLNEPVVSFIFEFSEEITVRHKGDLMYGNTVYTTHSLEQGVSLPENNTTNNNYNNNNINGYNNGTNNSYNYYNNPYNK